jgi:DedD protein
VLTLLAVIVLPLLLEDEPPPTSSLAVKMAVLPVAEVPAVQSQTPASRPSEAPIVTAAAPAQPEVSVPAAPPVIPAKPAPKIEAVKPEPPKPAVPDPQPPKPAPKPAPKPLAKSAPPALVEAQPAAGSKTYVVQLAALADSAKAQALKARADETGLPTYTDMVGNLTRVRVGPFDTHDAAMAAAVKLAGKGMPGQVTAK